SLLLSTELDADRPVDASPRRSRFSSVGHRRSAAARSKSSARGRASLTSPPPRRILRPLGASRQGNDGPCCAEGGCPGLLGEVLPTTTIPMHRACASLVLRRKSRQLRLRARAVRFVARQLLSRSD